VFADYYRIKDLEKLTMSKLGERLLLMARAADVVSLLRYCYAEPDMPKTLRNFIVLYAVCEVEVLWETGSFRELLAKSHEISLDFIRRVMDRVK
jgi:hypothetical protein